MDKSPLDDAVLDELERAGQMNMQKVKSNNSQKKDVLEVAGDLGINSVDDDQSSNVSLQIPVLSATAAMKFVEKEAQQEDIQNESYLRASMVKIDKKLDVQIFNAPTSEPVDTLDIKIIKQLGSGA